MDLAARYVKLTHWIVSRFGTDKFVHVNVGLLIWVLTIAALRTRPNALAPLAVVAGIEFLNEAMDWCGDRGWTAMDTLGDVAATLAWPILLALLSNWLSRNEPSSQNESERLPPEKALTSIQIAPHAESANQTEQSELARPI